ncbi:MAG: sulfurtransferase TusA family protein [Myxococcota bacterium]
MPSTASSSNRTRSRYCTGSFLSIARAAQELSAEGGGILELSGQNGSFPDDIRQWCMGSGSELVHLASDSGRFHARVRVPGRQPSGSYPTLEGPSASSSQRSTTYDSKETFDDNGDDQGPSVRALLDCRGLRGRVPVHKLTQRARLLPKDAEIDVLSDDPEFRRELRSWCETTGATIPSFQSRSNGVVRYRVRLTEAVHQRSRVRSAPHTQAKSDRYPAAKPVPLPTTHPTDQGADCRIVVSSTGDESLQGALRMALSATARGMQTSVLFTMTSLEWLKAAQPGQSNSWTQRLRRWLASDTTTPPTRVADPSDPTSDPAAMVARLLSVAEQQGVRFVACCQSMELMGITPDDLEARPNLAFDEMASFLRAASRAKLSQVF